MNDVRAHKSDRLMSAGSVAALSPCVRVSPGPRCELIEFYGRYHLPPAGGPGSDDNGTRCILRSARTRIENNNNDNNGNTRARRNPRDNPPPPQRPGISKEIISLRDFRRPFTPVCGMRMHAHVTLLCAAGSTAISARRVRCVYLGYIQPLPCSLLETLLRQRRRQ